MDVAVAAAWRCFVISNAVSIDIYCLFKSGHK